MIMEYNKAIGLPVFSIKNRRKIGKIKDFIIDYKTGKWKGVLVDKNEVFKTNKIITIDRIKKINRDGFWIEDVRVLKTLDEIEDLKQLLKEKIKIKENNVFTESGQELGKVKNFELDLNTNQLTKIIVSGGIIKDFLRGELIIPYHQIISIKKEAIIVKDTFIRSKSFKKQAVEEKGLAGAGMYIKSER